MKYRDAGVDIDAGNDLVERLKPAARATRRPELMNSLGGFASLFDLSRSGYTEPVLVSGTDGVGTKLKLAWQLGRHDTIGEDLVGMCVNDVLCQGAEPLFFLDYFACGKLDVDVAAAVVEGIAAGCRAAGCALAGGETAEMPGMYAPGEYDLAGFCVGAAEKSRLLDGSAAKTGDAVIGLASTGPHSNGYSLIRKILADTGTDLDRRVGDATLAEALLAPTRIYARPVLDLLGRFPVHALAHITGGGLRENVVRVIPGDKAVRLDSARWPEPPVFAWLREAGGLDREEMRRTFNCGIGLTVIAPAAHTDGIISALAAHRVDAWPIGDIVERAADRPRVTID